MAEKEDNLAPLITQCPNCEARFRVTESQLQVAHGRVRCGACLSVFDATAQLLMDGERLSATLDTDVDAFLDELASDDDAHADAPADIDAEITTDSLTSQQPGAAAPPGSWAAGGTARALSGRYRDEDNRDAEKDAQQDQHKVSRPDSEPGAGSDAEQEHEFPAELLALEAALLEDLKGPGQSSAVPDLTDDAGSSVDTAGHVDADTAADDDADWVGELDEAAWTEADVAVPEVDVPSDDSADNDEPASQDLEGIEEPAIPVEEVVATAATAEPVKSASAGSDVRRGFEDLRIPEPAVFDEAELPPRRSWTTLALIAIAVVALPAQVLWFQFDTWAKDERYRPMYSAICSVIGCDLPVMRDLTKLERREFHMRHHPESDNAYIFDLLIVNVADFPQPYPVIELIASTERGSLVAGRRFKPEEYLHGEVRPTDLLPPRTPVHISLEIEHPGHPNLEFQTRFR